MKHIAKIAAVGIALVVAGCSTYSGNGVPTGAHVVGGGLKISYSPDTAGTVVLMEKTTGKVVATESLDGNFFDFDVASEHDAGVLKAVLGEMPTNAQFVLYFVPNHK